MKKKYNVIEIELANKYVIKTTPSNLVYLNNKNWAKIKNAIVGDYIKTREGNIEIISMSISNF